MSRSFSYRFMSSKVIGNVKYTPDLLQLQVGKILECKKHENADKLYISKISIKDCKNGTMPPAGKIVQVCSALADHVPLQEMIQRDVVVLTNLKPVKMRSVVSEAMLLAAEINTGENGNKVNLVSPPSNSSVGDVLSFYPYVTDEMPPRVKNKAWTNIQEHLKTNNTGEVIYKTDDGKEIPLKVDASSVHSATSLLKNAIVR